MPSIRRLRVQVPPATNTVQREQLITLQIAGTAANNLLSAMRVMLLLGRPNGPAQTVREHITTVMRDLVLLSIFPPALEAVRLAERRALWLLAAQAPVWVAAPFDEASARDALRRLGVWVEDVRNQVAAHYDRPWFATWIDSNGDRPIDLGERVEGDPREVCFVGGALAVVSRLESASATADGLVESAFAFPQLVEGACVGYAMQVTGRDDVGYGVFNERD